MEITKIYWNLHNYCSGGCFYCPSHLWGGTLEYSIDKYMYVTQKFIDHYNQIQRKIDWTFNGGEPLEFFDFPKLLKLCKDNDGTVELNSNGGKLWLDWWAIAPKIDNLNLTFHYWQNINLIEFIIQSFQKSKKSIKVVVPFRPGYIEEDLQRTLLLEKKYNISVERILLHLKGNNILGYMDYTDDEIIKVKGLEFLQNYKNEQRKTFAQKNEERIHINPSYTGKLCNVGIERIYISHQGYATGSVCNNSPLGNIWDEGFSLPNNPSVCKMISCVHAEDKIITKFT